MEGVTSLLVLSVVASVWSCSPVGYREVHMDEMAHGVSIIAYGRVTKTFSYENEPRAYDVEFTVMCTYKGGPIPSRIKISEAGYFPGMCADKNFTVGTEYLAFLDMSNGIYRQMYDDTKMADTHMKELMTFCGLRLDYPNDMAPPKQRTCRKIEHDASSCHRYRIPRPMEPAIPEEGEESSGADVIPPLTATTFLSSSTTTTTTTTTTTVLAGPTSAPREEEPKVGSLSGTGGNSMSVLCLLFSMGLVLMVWS